jgi:sulfide:quinone oxidoreductase
MRKRVLILGAGFGGLELATRLSETIADAVRVTLIDCSDSFYFGFSKLEVMLGRQLADDVRLHYRDFEKDGVEFRQETVTGVHAAARRVTTDAGSYDADFVVVALRGFLPAARALHGAGHSGLRGDGDDISDGAPGPSDR